MDLLSLDSVSASPWGSPLLSNINLRVAPGQLVSVIGPNGSGKSSLLHLIAGGLAADSGRISLCGNSLSSWPQRERARALSLQAQHSLLNFPFTVEEVILLGRIPHRTGLRTDREVLEEVLQCTDTLSLRNRRFTQLSGGERQRVQLARAAAQIWRCEDAPGRLLLLDEPSSALDLAHQRMVLQLVQELAGGGVAVVMATHDFNLIASRADQVLVLDEGKQHSCGPAGEVLNRKMFRQVFDVEVVIENHPSHRSPLVVQL